MANVIQIKGLDGVLDLLKKLPAEVVSKNGGPVKAALRKGAKVIQEPAKTNLRAVTTNATTAEKRQNTKLLEDNVVVTRGKAPSDGKGERYLVRVRRKRYPRTSGEPVTTLKTAQLLEYGSSKQPAEPWLRPAFKSNAQKAIQVTSDELVKGVNRVVKKLSKG